MLKTCLSVAVFTVLSLPALAGDCDRWNSNNFWRDATDVEVTSCLSAGLDVGARGEDGETPLHFAAANGNAEVVEVLIAAGADVGARGEYGETPLHFAVAWYSNAEVVEVLITAGADVGARTKTGNTALHLAAKWSDSPKVVEVLIAAGADVGARTKDGDTALHLAAEWSSSPKVVEVLIAAGANPAKTNGSGRYQFFYAELNEALKGSKVYWRLNDARFK